ncbi:viperin family antiviral radical SAM protein [Spiroplasma culicicola]|uniref:S-adenosylmethionine-dependent nucleotide dehydratase n=1 Tax=Spiroplasma culicicola AES-1 TaxID=1276246 RepID=W6A7E8_9MOLU|nr:viperin family antiviral radical SAM protein [Spiroplasma culicicola]AHI52765.1 hypothetical protein SCULI_v1c04240 [Spiroplasma culicicola AES-1]
MYTIEQLNSIKLNFHFSMFCNMRCKFCFYAPLIAKAKREDNLNNWLEIIKKVAFFKAINFAGGEPTLYWNQLKQMAKLCKELGLKVTLITNGTVIKNKSQNEVNDLLQYFNSVGISMDSIDLNINQNSGRAIGNKSALSEDDYLEVGAKIKKAGCQLKINSVVHSLNKNTRMIDFIEKIDPYKWKIMQVSSVGQEFHKDFIISKSDFDKFLEINDIKNKHSFVKSIEDETTVTSTYVMIDGEGYFYNSDQIYNKNNKSILKENVDVLEEFNKCNFDINSQLDRYKNEK